jgi:hypothetical protein
MSVRVKRAMQGGVASELPLAMRKVHRRLERWRSKRTGRARIPEALWAAAGELAREHGVNAVSRALHLEFNQLKRWAESGGPVKLQRATAAPPAFVELIAPATSAQPACVFELEGRRGKLRIELPPAATAELTGLTQALWEMIS